MRGMCFYVITHCRSVPGNMGPGPFILDAVIDERIVREIPGFAAAMILRPGGVT
jgi:hypothetical protein